MDTLPPELILETILKLQPNEIDFFCSTNSYIKQVCSSNEDYIYKSLIQRDHGFKSTREVYELLNLKPKKGVGVSIKSLIDNFVESGKSTIDEIEFYYKLGAIDLNTSSDLIGTTPLMYLIELQADRGNGTPVDVSGVMRFISLGVDLQAKNEDDETVLGLLENMRDSSTHNFEGVSTLIDYVNARNVEINVNVMKRK
jgi:hypothetical protein